MADKTVNPAPTGASAKPRIAGEPPQTKPIQTSPIREVAEKSAKDRDEAALNIIPATEQINGAEENSQPCACIGEGCNTYSLDWSRFHCRKGNDPEEEKVGAVDATDDLIEALARIQCEEEGFKPEQLYCGVLRWTTYQPEARAFIRMFNLLVSKAIES